MKMKDWNLYESGDASLNPKDIWMICHIHRTSSGHYSISAVIAQLSFESVAFAPAPLHCQLDHQLK